jgi:dipeptidyl aminopeptidase/acylaminoacyl peptidase
LRHVDTGKERAITDAEKNIEEFFFQNDSKHIVYRLQATGLNKGPLFQIDIHTGLTRNLTPWEGASVEDYHYDYRCPDEVLVALKFPKAEHSDVYRLNLANGAIVLEEKHEPYVLESFLYGWIPDKRLVVRAKLVLNNKGSKELWTRKTRKAPWRLIRRFEQGDHAWASGFSSDGKVLIVYTTLDSDIERLAAINVDTGATKVLGRDDKCDVYSTFLDGDYFPMGVEFESDRKFWKPSNDTFKKVLAAAHKLSDGDVDVLDADSDSNKYVVSITRDDGPESYYLIDVAAKKSAFLFDDRPDLKHYKFAKRKPISFVTRDGLTEHGYLTLPVGINPQQLPLVLLVHGGPVARDHWEFDYLAQWLANRGYAVLQVNFRGSCGYGRSLLQAGLRQWGSKMNDDLVDAKQWAVKQGIADPNKVAVCGISYGGYATLAALTFTPDEFRCGIDVAGISSLLTQLKAERAILHDCTYDFGEMLVGKLGRDDALLKARSPLYFVDRIKVPLLIGHGTADTVVNVSESEQLVAALKKHGKSFTYYPVQDGEHSWPWDQEFTFQAEKFLSKHLGGRVEPDHSWITFLQSLNLFGSESR